MATRTCTDLYLGDRKGGKDVGNGATGWWFRGFLRHTDSQQLFRRLRVRIDSNNQT